MKRELATITLAAAALIGGSFASSASVGDDTAEPSSTGVKDPDAKRDLTALPTTQDVVFEDGVSRTWGTNRYATAAAIAEAYGWTFENTTSVFIATGESFPDALAVGPSTFIEGPLLFVKLDSIPSQTRSALSALQPCYIHVVGGDKVVNDKVFQQLKDYANPTLCEEPAP